MLQLYEWWLQAKHRGAFDDADCVCEQLSTQLCVECEQCDDLLSNPLLPCVECAKEPGNSGVHVHEHCVRGELSNREG